MGRHESRGNGCATIREKFISKRSRATETIIILYKAYPMYDDSASMAPLDFIGPCEKRNSSMADCVGAAYAIGNLRGCRVASNLSDNIKDSMGYIWN